MIKPLVSCAHQLASGIMLVVVWSAAGAPEAQAHIQLDEPAARYTSQKVGPCGLRQEPGRGDRVSVYAPGETITVKWRETIDHPSHYRISFDEDGHDSFVDPSHFYEFYSNDAVLLDEIPDKRGGAYEVQVTLPDVECERCTLQLVQVMYDKAPYGDGNDLYYQCADLALRRAPLEPSDMGSPHEPDLDAPDMPEPMPDMGPDALPDPNDLGADGALDEHEHEHEQEMGESSAPAPAPSSEGEGGCASVTSRSSGSAGLWMLGVLGVLGAWMRRRRLADRKRNHVI